MIAYVFPGQGAQVVGMGKDFYEKSDISKKIFDKATELLGFDMAKLCFEEKFVSVKQLYEATVANFVGHERLLAKIVTCA